MPTRHGYILCMCTGFVALLLLLAVGGQHMQRRRSILQLAKVTSCASGKSFLQTIWRYYNYGCWCGLRGAGKPVDGTDSIQEPETKIQCPKKIQVLNVPTIFTEEKTVDKLIIHFQRQRNGGGEVLDVEYPTSVEGCAFVTFVKEEDANNVLKYEQTLEVDKKRYKLKVCEVGSGESATDQVQVIQFVIAKLDTSYFHTAMVQELIVRHRFKILNYQGCVAEIKGSFSSLKELRRILMKYYIYHQSMTAVTDSGQSTDSKELKGDPCTSLTPGSSH